MISLKIPLRQAHLPWLYFLVFLAIAGWHAFRPELVSEANGLGWDGVEYAQNIKQMKETILDKRLDSYRFQRLLPQLLVYLGLSSLSATITDQTIVRGFILLNTMAIALSLWLWHQIAKLLGLGVKSQILGWIALFINFATVKMPFYTPVLCDTTALAFGMAILYFFLKKKSIPLLLVSLLGAFCFPTLLYTGLLLFTFPYQSFSKPTADAGRIGVLFSVTISAGFLLFILLLRQAGHTYLVNPMSNVTLVASVCCAMIYLYIATLPLHVSLSIKTLPLAELRSYRTVVAVIVLLVVRGIIYAFSSGNTPRLNYKGFLAHVALEAVTNPLAFLVAHVVYLGPAVLLVIYAWGKIVQSAKEMGWGFFVVFSLFTLLSIGSESRQFITSWPLFVVALCVTLDKHPLPDLFYAVLFLLSLAFSKIGFPLNILSFSGNLLRLPEQRYFMHHGPWMSDDAYFGQGFVIVICFGLLYFLFLRRTKIQKQEGTPVKVKSSPFI